MGKTMRNFNQSELINDWLLPACIYPTVFTLLYLSFRV
jgi:hypothetical protein